MILSRDLIDICLDNLGRYHPIIGISVPDTMVQFRAPRSRDDVLVLWHVVQQGYEWAMKECENEDGTELMQ
jgi:hypothetical protein